MASVDPEITSLLNELKLKFTYRMKSPRCGEFPFSHIQTFHWKEIPIRPKLRINVKPDENKIEFPPFLLMHQ